MILSTGPAPAPAPATAFDATLVGRKAEALWGDPDDEEAGQEWYACTVVAYRPRATKWKFVIHFSKDDETNCSPFYGAKTTAH